MILRNATIEDVNLIYEWANDSECRANSFCTDKISYETHVTWYMNHFQARECNIFIGMEDEEPVGQIRIEKQGAFTFLSYSVCPSKRGLGYGRKLLLLVEEEVRRNPKFPTTLVGEVKHENVASCHCFESLGYEKHETEFITYKKTLLKNNITRE